MEEEKKEKKHRPYAQQSTRAIYEGKPNQKELKNIVTAIVSNTKQVSTTDAGKIDFTSLLRFVAASKEAGTTIKANVKRWFFEKFHARGVPYRLTLNKHSKVLFKLFPHQVEAVKKLQDLSYNKRTNQGDLRRAENTKGVILVMQMGLGKTLVSLTHAMMLPDKRGMPALVVCGKSVLNMWQRESFDKFLEPGRCKVLYLHPSVVVSHEDHLSLAAEERAAKKFIAGLTVEKLKEYDFVVTTYDMVVQTWSKLMEEDDAKNLPKRWTQELVDNPRNPDKPFVRYHKRKKNTENLTLTGANVLFGPCWKILICDESQTFAGKTLKKNIALLSVIAKEYLCLSGTPIRNKVQDVYAQLAVMDSLAEPPRRDEQKKMLPDLRDRTLIIMQYTDPIVYQHVVMPDRVDVQVIVNMSAFEQRVYEFVKDNLEQAMELVSSGTIQNSCVLALFTRLRQLCIAPHLIYRRNKSDSAPNNKFLQEFDQELRNNPNLAGIEDPYKAGCESSKVRAVLQIVRDTAQDEKVIIFCSFAMVLEMISWAFRGADEKSKPDFSPKSHKKRKREEEKEEDHDVLEGGGSFSDLSSDDDDDDDDEVNDADARLGLQYHLQREPKKNRTEVANASSKVNEQVGKQVGEQVREQASKPRQVASNHVASKLGDNQGSKQVAKKQGPQDFVDLTLDDEEDSDYGHQGQGGGRGGGGGGRGSKVEYASMGTYHGGGGGGGGGGKGGCQGLQLQVKSINGDVAWMQKRHKLPQFVGCKSRAGRTCYLCYLFAVDHYVEVGQAVRLQAQLQQTEARQPTRSALHRQEEYSSYHHTPPSPPSPHTLPCSPPAAELPSRRRSQSRT